MSNMTQGAKMEYRKALRVAMQGINARRGPEERVQVARMPVTKAQAAWVGGAAATFYATMEALGSKGDGKVYHRLKLGSDAEEEWHKGCAWMAHKLMDVAMMREELRRNEERN